MLFPKAILSTPGIGDFTGGFMRVGCRRMSLGRSVGGGVCVRCGIQLGQGGNETRR